MATDLLVALVSGVLGGGVVSVLLGHLLRKKADTALLDKTKAETDKAKVEVDKTKAETEYLRAQTVLLQKDIDRVQSQVAATQEKINTIVKYSLSFYLFEHLSKLYHHDEGFKYHPNNSFQRDLRLLRDLGYLELFHISDLREGDKLVDKIRPTPLGNLLVELREHRERL